MNKYELEQFTRRRISEMDTKELESQLTLIQGTVVSEMVLELKKLHQRDAEEFAKGVFKK